MRRIVAAVALGAALLVASGPEASSDTLTPPAWGERYTEVAQHHQAGGPDRASRQSEVGTDAVGDVAYCEGDIRGFGANNATSSATILVATFVAASCWRNPSTNNNWVYGATVADWVIDTNGDDSIEFYTFLANNGSGVVAAVYDVRGGGFTLACSATPVVDQSVGAYGSGFAASCIGNPTNLRISAAMQWDENPFGSSCVCPNDFAPDGGWGPVTRVGPEDEPPPTTTTSTTAPPPPPPPPPQPRQGYWMVGSTGEVFAFGDAASYGSAPGAAGAPPKVDLEPTPTGRGYWIVDAAGQVFSFGDARYLGGGPALKAGETVTSLSRTVSGNGYWLFTNLARVIAFGDAEHHGDMRDIRLNAQVLDSIPTPGGRGYYMVAADGGIFTFGDAVFRGSMGGTPLNKPVQSLVPDGDGVGYWLVASDGGIFAFDADFHGSMGGTRLNRPITGMVGFSRGYLMVGEDGGIFSFGEAPFFGSLGNNPPAHPIVSVAVLNQM